jgi:hypothetical protein
MKTIDTSGLAKVSSGTAVRRVRQLTNDLRRLRKQLKRAEAELTGLQVLESRLRRHLQFGDYEHLLGQVEREAVRLRDEERELLDQLKKEKRQERREMAILWGFAFRRAM